MARAAQHPFPFSRRRNRGIERRLAAIIGLDIASYSLMMGAAEEATHRRVGDCLARIYREIEKNHGSVFSFGGDGLMAEFPSAVAAVKCSLRIQADQARRNHRLPTQEQIQIRIGVNTGEVVLQNNRVGGNTVNVAARLEAIADPGGIALSEEVFRQVHRVIAMKYTFLGERAFKNIRELVRAYAIPADECAAWAGVPALPRTTGTGAAVPGMDYRPSLAVMPFRTVHKDEADAWFAEGMADDIIRALGSLDDILVIARSSTQALVGMPLDLRRVGYDLDVRYVLHGSVRRSANSLRVTVELCEARTGTVVWADRFDGQMIELFELQDRIAIRVATSIAPHLREREISRALRKHPDSLTAFDLTLQALSHFYRMDSASLDRAEASLLEAIRHDADYALAYTHLASVRMTRIGQGWVKDDVAAAEAAGQAAIAAVERDRTDALALAFCGQYHSFVRKDFAAALEMHERALLAGPSCAWAWGLSSLPLGYTGDVAKAVKHAERAVRLAPLGPEAYWFEYFLAQAHYLSEQFDDAVAWGRLSASHAAANTSNLRTLIASLVAKGDLDSARYEAFQLTRLVPNYSLQYVQKRTHFSGTAAEVLISRLRIAGIPEQAPAPVLNSQTS